MSKNHNTTYICVYKTVFVLNSTNKKYTHNIQNIIKVYKTFLNQNSDFPKLFKTFTQTFTTLFKTQQNCTQLYNNLFFAGLHTNLSCFFLNKKQNLTFSSNTVQNSTTTSHNFNTTSQTYTQPYKPLNKTIVHTYFYKLYITLHNFTQLNTTLPNFHKVYNMFTQIYNTLHNSYKTLHTLKHTILHKNSTNLKLYKTLKVLYKDCTQHFTQKLHI